MLRTRVFPTLLYRGEGLVKGQKFTNHRYVGDVLNAVRIYNMNEVDELALLDIGATEEGRSIDVDLVEKVATECMMPLAAGGGVRSLDDASLLIDAGAEKVVLNSVLYENIDVVGEIASKYGNQSVVASLDAKRNDAGGYDLYSHNATRKQDCDLIEFAKKCEAAGAGEILITSIDQEGSISGYDLDLVRVVASSVDVPVIANGGGGALDSLKPAVDAGASALTAGAAFVFFGRRRAVLINFPDDELLEAALEGEPA